MRSERSATQFIEHTCANHLVNTTRRRGSNLHQIETDYLATALHHARDKVCRLIERQSTHNRRSGRGAILDAQSIDVEANIDLCGQRLNDLRAEFSPRLTLEASTAQHTVGEAHNALIRIGQLLLGIAEIAHTNLHQALHLGHIAQQVEHNRGVRIFETLIGVAQVAVSVEVQHSEATMLLCHCAHRTVWCRVVTTYQPNQLTLLDQRCNLLIYLVIHLLASAIDRCKLRSNTLGISTIFERIDHILSLGAPHAALLAHQLIGRKRRDTSTPSIGIISIVEVELSRCLANCLGTVCRAVAIRNGHVPRCLNQYQIGLVGRKRQAVIVAICHTHPIGVEEFVHNCVLLCY